MIDPEIANDPDSFSNMLGDNLESGHFTWLLEENEDLLIGNTRTWVADYLLSISARLDDIMPCEKERSNDSLVSALPLALALFDKWILTRNHPPRYSIADRLLEKTIIVCLAAACKLIGDPLRIQGFLRYDEVARTLASHGLRYGYLGAPPCNKRQRVEKGQMPLPTANDLIAHERAVLEKVRAHHGTRRAHCACARTNVSSIAPTARDGARWPRARTRAVARRPRGACDARRALRVGSRARCRARTRAHPSKLMHL